MGGSRVQIHNLILDEIGRVTLSEEELGTIEVASLSAGASNTACNDTSNGNCRNLASCSGSLNRTCSNSFICASVENYNCTNSSVCTQAPEVEP